MRTMLKDYLSQNNIYVLYIHPFELSTKKSPNIPKNTPWYTKKRFEYGRNYVSDKLRKLIGL